MTAVAVDLVEEHAVELGGVGAEVGADPAIPVGRDSRRRPRLAARRSCRRRIGGARISGRLSCCKRCSAWPRKAQGSRRCTGPWPARRNWTAKYGNGVVIVPFVHLHRVAPVLHIGGALDGSGLGFGLGQRRQQQGREDGDDGNDHQQLDQGEGYSR